MGVLMLNPENEFLAQPLLIFYDDTSACFTQHIEIGHNCNCIFLAYF